MNPETSGLPSRKTFCSYDDTRRSCGGYNLTYSKKNDISYKARLAELGIPAWKFYDSKSQYALVQESSEAKGEFMQLYDGGSSVPMPSFAATSGRKAKGRNEASESQMLSIELRTPNDTMMRIQEEMSQDFIQSIKYNVR